MVARLDISFKQHHGCTFRHSVCTREQKMPKPLPSFVVQQQNITPVGRSAHTARTIDLHKAGYAFGDLETQISLQKWRYTNAVFVSTTYFLLWPSQGGWSRAASLAAPQGLVWRARLRLGLEVRVAVTGLAEPGGQTQISDLFYTEIRRCYNSQEMPTDWIASDDRFHSSLASPCQLYPLSIPFQSSFSGNCNRTGE